MREQSFPDSAAEFLPFRWGCISRRLKQSPVFQSAEKNFNFLLPLGIGGVIGFAVFMFLIDSLFAKYQTEIVCLFMGLVIGSIPSFLKEANGDEPFKKLIGSILSLALRLQ